VLETKAGTTNFKGRSICKSQKSSTVKASTVKSNTVEASTVKASTVKGSTAKASTVKSSTVKASTVKSSTVKASGVNTEKEGPLWKRYLKEKDRDHMYIPRQGCTWIPAIPLIGRRVDTIHHCLGELARMNKEIRADLAELAASGEESSKYPRMKSAFIRFNTQSAAYMACQTLLNADPLHSSARHINVSVRELRWSTLS